MSHRLDPLIQEKLRSFARRRRRLIVLRGVFAALAMLFFAMILVAVVDFASTYYFDIFLPKWTRYALSGVAYLAVIVVAWRQCLTQLLHAPDARGLARLIEHAEPRLREDLISAVELGSSKGDVFDSEQFRALLQQDVAIRMEGLKMKSLLPMALIKRYIAYVCVIVVVVAGGIIVTHGQLHTLLLRALMPSANLANVSRTKVQVVEPTGGDKVVPQGSTQRVEIQISGQRTNKAVLEMETEKGGAQVVEMQPLGGDRFAATVQVQREDVTYRVKAGDHLSRDYTFDARERPFVTQFEKTYHFPKYSKLPDKTVAETDGGLVGLEGSEVDLKLRTNQPVKVAELRLEQGKNTRTIALTPGPDGSLSARVALNASGTYRVHLVSKETDFANEFSPENELRAEPDLVPSVELTQPKADLILPNNELVDLAGQASDDLALAKIAQLVKVNDGPWKETVLAKENLGQKSPISYRWDLYDLSAKPGDLVVTKLVATDLKGNKGESRPLQITITAAGFEMRRMQAVESLRALNETVHTLAASAEALAKVGQKSREQIQGSDNADTRRQAAMALAGALGDFESKFTQTWSTLTTAVKDAPAGHMSAELVVLGRDLARLSAIPARVAKTHADLIAADPGLASAKELISQAGDECNALVGRARVAEQAMEAFTTAEESAVLTENGQVVAREQQRLMELAAASGNDPQKWQPLVSRMRVTLTQTKAMEDLLAPIATRSGSPLKGRAKDTITALAKRRGKLESALSAGEPSAKLLLDPTMELTRSLKEYSRQFSDWHRELGWKPVELLQALYRDVGPAYEQVPFLARDLAVVRAGKNLAPATQATLNDARWAARGEVLKSYGDLEELRTNADNAWVSDLRTATAALEALHNMAAGAEKQALDDKFTTIDRSLRILESGHQLAEILEGLNFLATNERWDIRSLAARTQSPRDWKWIESRLRTAPEEMNKAKELLHKLAETTRWKPVFVFASYQPDPNKPGQYTFQIEDTREGNKAATYRVGDNLPNSKLNIAGFVKKAGRGENGQPKDVSEITISSVAPNEPPLVLGNRTGGDDGSGKVVNAFEGAQQILWKAQQLPAWKQLGGEMDQRNNQDRLPASEKADAEVLAGQVKLALDLLRQHMDEARKQLENVSPKISELAAALAKEQKDLDEKAEEQAKKAEEQKPEEAKTEAQKQLADQKKLDQKLETLKDLIRAEANQQNILDKEQRELMRDADDALAMLKDPPPAAEQALQDASNDPQAQQKADLQRAQEQQKKIETALNQIAKHFDAVEQGKPLAETRAALREAEKELNTKEELDQQFAHAQMLAEMAQKDAAQLLKELEAKLPENPLMQKELSDITKDALAAAEQKLTQATGQEKNVAQQVNQQAEKEQAAQKQAQQQSAQTAAQAAKEAAEAAKQAQQAAQNAEQQAQQAGNAEAQKQANAAKDQAAQAQNAANEAAKAAEQMAKADNAQQAAQAAQQAAQKAGDAAKAAQNAEDSAKKAEANAQQSAQQGGDKQAANQQSAQQANQSAQQAEKAAQAAQKAQAMAQQAAQQAQAMAQNAQPQPNAAPNPAQQAANNAAQAAKKAAEAAKAAQQAAQGAEQQAKTAANQNAEQQADAAGNEAGQAAQEAQAAADAAQQAADAGNAQQAAKAAQQAAQKAGEAAMAADKAANAAQQAQNSSNQAAQQGGDKQAANQQAAQQAGQAQQQAQAAAQAARQAQAMAQQAAQQAQAAAQPNAQLANAAAQQQPVAQNAADAAADVQRAGRHEMRLGNPAGEPLQQLGQQIQQTAQNEVPAAQQALQQAQQAAQAQAPVNQAAAQLAQNLANLQNAQNGAPMPAQPNAQTPAGQQPPAGQPPAGQQPAGQQAAAAQPPPGQQAAAAPAGTPPPSGDATPASPAEQAAMARALDALDQQLNAQAATPGAPQAAQAGQPGQPAAPGGQPGNEAGQPTAAQAAMAQAAQAAANAMRQNRAQQAMEQGMPDSAKSMAVKDKSEHGALVDSDAGGYKLDATAQGLKKGEWGRLPKKLADQLTKGQQEAVAGDYRQAVETYYKVIAERAKKQ